MEERELEVLEKELLNIWGCRIYKREYVREKIANYFKGKKQLLKRTGKVV